VEEQRLEQRTRFDLEMMAEIGFTKGIENYSRHLSGAKPGEPPPTLVDYLPKDALMFLDESHVLIGQLSAMYNGDRAQDQPGGLRLPPAVGAGQPPAEVRRVRAEDAADHLRLGHAGRLRKDHADQVVEQVVRPTGLVDPQ
jgi:excinuclease ABC subunit B